MSTPLFAIVVLNWNGLELLREFASEWLRLTPPDAELIVVDNASTDGSAEYLRTHYPSIRLICHEENYGFAEGYNRAIDKLTHPYIVLLNSDAIPTDGWLDHPRRVLAEMPHVAVLSPKIHAWRERAQGMFEYAGAAGGYVDILGYPFCRGRILDTIEPDRGQYDAVESIAWASGACLIVRRSVYLAVGGLDPIFFAHQEEIDLAWRIKARGGEILSYPHVVYHIGGASLPMESPRKTYLNFRNNLVMLYKNLPWYILVPILVARLVLDGLALCLFALRGQWHHARAVARAWWDAPRLMHQRRDVRRQNLRQTTRSSRAMLSPVSIILNYYLLGRRRYSEIVR